MKWPATSDEMKAAGYLYDGDGVCRGCQAPIEWWISKSGKRMPISVIDQGTLQTGRKEVRQSHFVDCPEAQNFRKK